MTPKDLKTGHICLHADGRYSMVAKNTYENWANNDGGNTIFSSRGRTGLNKFNDDFTWKNNKSDHEKGIAIIAIYEPTNLCNSVEIFENTSFKPGKDFTCIWEKDKTEEMTLEEVCQLLGRKIKIIS